MSMPFLPTIEKSCCIVLKKQVLAESHRKLCRGENNFSNATCSKPKTYYPVIKEIPAVLAPSFLSGNVNVLTSGKP